jgi:hypothetical protein
VSDPVFAAGKSMSENNLRGTHMITIRTFTREDAETVRQILYPDLSLTAVSELID